MKIYHIKQNGYTIGQVRGKNNAIQFVNKVICNEFGQTDFFEWKPFYLGRMIITNKGKEAFTIEEAV